MFQSCLLLTEVRNKTVSLHVSAVIVGDQFILVSVHCRNIRNMSNVTVCFIIESIENRWIQPT